MSSSMIVLRFSRPAAFPASCARRAMYSSAAATASSTAGPDVRNPPPCFTSSRFTAAAGSSAMCSSPPEPFLVRAVGSRAEALPSTLFETGEEFHDSLGHDRLLEVDGQNVARALQPVELAVARRQGAQQQLGVPHRYRRVEAAEDQCYGRLDPRQ